MKTNFMKISIYLTLAFVLSGCCPPDGVDISRTVPEFPLAIDYYKQGAPVAVNLVPKNDTTVELFDKDALSNRPLYLEHDRKLNNRIIYYFNSEWNSERIKSLNVKLNDIELHNLDISTIEKTSFQRESENYNLHYSNPLTYLDQIECIIKSVAEVFIPRAQAMSCKPSNKSVISYRQGTLIRVNLN